MIVATWYGREEEVSIGQESALNVTIHEEGGKAQVRAGDEVLASFDSVAEAQGVAMWARYQLGAGTNLKELGRMLRGESSVEAADGAPATAPEPEEPAPKKSSSRKKASAGAARKADADAGFPDVAVLVGGTVKALKSGLASGEYDAVLDDVLSAEQAGRARKSALEAIAARKAEVG